MSKVFALIVTFFFTIFISISCSKDGGSGGGGGGGNTLNCSTVTNKAFTADVSPIIQGSCNVAGCHASGSFNGPGALTNYTEVFNARSLIRSAVASGAMPKTGALSTAQKNSILCWIDSGGPNN